MTKLELLAKFVSGRFCLALVAGAVLIIATLTDRIESKDIVYILIIVFQSYFNSTPKEPIHG